MVHLFLHLIICANSKDSYFKGVFIKKGQLLTSRRKLADDLGLTERTVRTCLKRLEDSNEILIEKNQNFSLITISQYISYQHEIEYRATHKKTFKQSTNTSSLEGGYDKNDPPTTHQRPTNDPLTTHKNRGETTHKTTHEKTSKQSTNTSSLEGGYDKNDPQNDQLEKNNKRIKNPKFVKKTTHIIQEDKNIRIQEEDSSTIQQSSSSISSYLLKRKPKKSFSAGNKKFEFLDRVIKAFTGAHGSYEVLNIGKERAAAGKILAHYKKKYPNSTSEETLAGLGAYFEKCVKINDQWMSENMSLSLIVSKFNEINKKLTNGKQKSGVSDSYREELLARLHTAASNKNTQ